MSYTEIFGFNKNGDAYLKSEVKNAWRGGMAIWRFLEQKYLPPFIPDYAKQRGCSTVEDCEKYLGYRPSRCSSMQTTPLQAIWDLEERDDVSITDKICLFTTFDNCLIKKEDIPRVIEAFRAFEGETSLKEQADVLEQLYADEDCIAVGWNQTSVNYDSWGTFGGYDEEKDESIPYNCLTGTQHYWLFDELK